jgi:hypothetical protein
LLAPLCYPPPTHGSHLCKLTTFNVIELFFLYGPPTLKTLCNLTSFCYCKNSLPSHTPKKQTQKRKRKKENINIYKYIYREMEIGRNKKMREVGGK